MDLCDCSAPTLALGRGAVRPGGGVTAWGGAEATWGGACGWGLGNPALVSSYRKAVRYGGFGLEHLGP